MEIDELMKQLAQGGITVQGDFVMEKKVEYEVNNVEAGGIGIQVVNGKDIPTKNEKDMPAKSTPGPRKQFLFIEGDASWEEQGRQRNPSKENTVVRRRERDRIVRYLKEHCLSQRQLTCTQGDTLNDVVACFLVEWRERKLIAKDFAGTAVWRFLTEECGLESAVTDKAYGKEIKEWVAEKRGDAITQRQIHHFLLNS